MTITYIEVPDMNDSLSRVVLNGKAYYVRFTYNDTLDCWKFGLYDSLKNPLSIGIKIVPRFPLNLFTGYYVMPDGYFGAASKFDRIGRNDFKNGSARFAFIPATI